MLKETDVYANDEDERAAMIEELAGGVYPPPASPVDQRCDADRPLPP